MPDIPAALIATVAEVLAASYTHPELDSLMGELIPLYDQAKPEGNKISKCKAWLRQGNSIAMDGLLVLGKVLEEFMEKDSWPQLTEDDFRERKGRIERALGNYDLGYSRGGLIISTASGVLTRSIDDVIRTRDLMALNAEFERTLKNVQADPASAVTSACALLESLFKVYITDEKLEMPAKETIKPLWSVVQKHLGLDPSSLEDDDLKRILSGLSSVVDGIGALRTHAGSAHGHGRKAYRLKPRHALLTAHAALTLASFVIETWNERTKGLG